MMAASDADTIELDTVIPAHVIREELDLWRGRLLAAKRGDGPYSVHGCRCRLDALLDEPNAPR